MPKILKWAPVTLLLSLTACAQDPAPAPLPFVVATPPAPIAAECNPRGRANMSPIPKAAGNKTPLGNLENGLIDAGTVDARNKIRETRCYCAQVAERGSEDEKSKSQKLCGLKAPAAPAPTGWKALVQKVTL
ncbi:hypothetical protein [Hyphomicrobium sp.]|uniref:hypothetical protein n=1 Tax=Hyphomicrobium sp. TaxID=82 RepID=UPI001E1443D9|nr:hypothetical protein [Hyphomicrobium sp.]MBY0559885.1 hypothetical protein [Hyphomicrobium sp.]